MIRLATTICAALAFIGVGLAADAKPPADTTVYYVPGKKRVHVETCRRLESTEGKTVMTYQEAAGKGLPLCSRCPGSTSDDPETPGSDSTDPSKPDPGTTVYSGGGKRVHVKGCRRLSTDPAELAKMTTMTLAEAEAQGLPLCSRCPGSTTEGRQANLPESWVNPPPDADGWVPETHDFVPSERAPLVSMGADGKLVYAPYTDQGDRIVDFSHCGYARSEVPIPTVPVVETLSPPPGEATPVGNLAYPMGPDSTATIQAALDRAAALAPDAQGFRGAVLLEQGRWHLTGSLRIASGVVLRGQGDGETGTVLVFTIPEGGADGLQVGGGGVTSEELKPVSGQLSKGTDSKGAEAYILTLDDGYQIRVKDPRFKPDVKLEGYVGDRVVLTMKAVVTTLGSESTARLKHNMPYEVTRLEAGQQPPPLDPDLTLPDQLFGSGDVTESRIADSYVPTGSTRITLVDASGFAPGDWVNVAKTTNAAWIDLLGVGERLRHIRAGEQGLKKKPWEPQAYSHLRRITAVDGNTITLDLMLTQSIAAEHGGGYVRKEQAPALDTACGVENLRVVSNYDTAQTSNDKSANYGNLQNGIAMTAIDGWVRDCTVLHVAFAAVRVEDSRFCTVRDVKSLQPVGPLRGGKRYTFSIGGGSHILVYRCYAEDGRHDFVIGARMTGPYAFVHCTALRGGQSEPHGRWGCATLFDNVTLKEGGALAAINRGDSGSGHGWAGGNNVFWNCAAHNIVVADPETDGENNFAIGYTGPAADAFDARGLYYANTRAGYWGTPREGKYYGYALMGNGHIESPAGPVKPDSLFEQQLIDRIGAAQARAVLE